MQKVYLLYGGRSSEHDISRRSARFVLKSLSAKKYEIIPIGIDAESGAWFAQSYAALMKGIDQAIDLPINRTHNEYSTTVLQAFNPCSGRSSNKSPPVVICMIHGTTGEDGCMQALCELLGYAYVGSDVMGSAVGMDKIVSKQLAATAKIPMGPYSFFDNDTWEQSRKSLCSQITQKLGSKLFVKPARLGSSVGITHCKEKKQLEAAIDYAFEFDTKVIIEKALPIREIECAVMGFGNKLAVATPGELVAEGGFYDYDTKYINTQKTHVNIPAKLSKTELNKAKKMAMSVFTALNLEGLARVDLFYETKSKRLLFNEVNTLPGFTETSFFPLLWAHEGKSGGALIDELIGFALARHRRKAILSTKRM